ncbi:NAD(P)-dependent oxidoreductase [Nonomuraea angiospora]|uniref:NAD-dependent epimerase/dehydratase family protein n=1 Tax=Nonomuraea angiospora TaxID=46172 RepID=UPI0033FC9F4C
MRVLVTGASGLVAGQVIPALEMRHELRLTDLADGDLADADFARRVTDGVDAILHLAANANPDASWDDLAGPNMRAVTNVLDAAGARRVVLASSVHVMGQYRAGPVEPDWQPSPCCRYGAAKAFAEAAGRMHSHRYGGAVICLRLGATVPKPPARQALPAWLAPDDLRRLVLLALEAPVRFEVCHGVSANTSSIWSTRNNLGYTPTCDSEPYRDQTPDVDGWGPCPSYEEATR